MEKIIIFGAGDVARLAYYYFKNDSNFETVAFTVDKKYVNDESFLGLPLIPFENLVKHYSPNNFKIFIAIGYSEMNTKRANKYFESKKLGYELVSYVSNKCTYLSDYKPGDNCFILEDNTVQPFVKIGNNVTLWSGNHIGHDSVIEDHCFISSHVVISGNVKVNPYCFIGVNASIINSVTIAPKTFIGPGAVITKSTIEGGVYLSSSTKSSSLKSEEVKI